MSKRYLSTGVSALLSASLVTILAPVAVAQERGSQVSGIEEVIVTARKREENLQDVPLSVTAISAQQIEQQGIKDIEDAIQTDSSLQFDLGFAPYDTRIVIRGLSPTRGRPNVATLVDGIDISSEAIGVAGGSMLINPRLIDIQRIEVVKGPQSALYGRSAFAGAIQYVTKDPSDEMEAEGGVDVGSDGQRELKLGFSGPLGEKLGFRVSGHKWNEDGFYNNAITGRGVGGGEGQGGSLSLKWEPTESLDFKLRYEYADDEFGQPAQAFVAANTTNTVPESASSCNRFQSGGIWVVGPVRDSTCAPGTPLLPVQALPGALEAATGNTGRFDDMTIPAYRGVLPDASGLRVLYTPDYSRSTDGGLTGPDYTGSQRDVQRASLVANWQTGIGTVSSLTGFTKANVTTDIDLDHFAVPGTSIGQDLSSITQGLTTWGTTHQFSQELRFTSDFDGPLNFIVGAQYWKENAEQFDRNLTIVAAGAWCQLFDTPGPAPAGELSPGSCGGALVPPMGAPGSTPPGPNSFSSITVSQFVDDVERTRPTTYVQRIADHQSVYAQLQWDVTDSFSLSAEARYIDEDNSISGPDAAGAATGPGTVILCGSSSLRRCGTTIPTAGFATPAIVGQTSFERTEKYTTPRFSAEWSPTDNILTYASFGIGQKPGGFSSITIGAFGLEPTARDDIEFKPERMKEYELGIKSTWLERRLVLNGALFYQDFTDKQVSTQEIRGTILGNVIKNAASAEVRGLEIGVEWQPLDQFTLAAGYTYLDTEYKNYIVTGGGAPEIARVGNCELIAPPIPTTATPTGTALTATCRINRSGNSMEDVPENAITALATYRSKLDNGWGIMAELQTRYQDERFAEDDNNIVLDSYSLTDLRFGVEGERWSVIAYVDNVFDDDTIKSAGTGPGNAFADFRFGQIVAPGSQAGIPGQPANGLIPAPLIPTLVFATLPDPRTYGLRMNIKF